MAHRTTSLLLLNSKPCRCYKEHVQLVFFFFLQCIYVLHCNVNEFDTEYPKTPEKM